MILANGGATALAAQQVTRTVPIIFWGVPIRWRMASSKA
jgi:hypothetical protein